MWKQKANETPLFSINGDNAKNANYLYYHGNTGGFLALRSDILSVFALGDCRKGAERFSGTIYETIVIAGHVRYGHQRLIEGYLAWKWGIEKKLPRSHPYYRVPPRKS
jgi:hypothetical protein